MLLARGGSIRALCLFLMRKNFIQTVEITPEEFERQVNLWLKRSSHGLKNFRVTHRKKLEGHGGEYELDAVAEFEAFDGASMIVLVECKYYKNPVERDIVMLLDAKIRDTGSHKGIVFTTSGFQSGALEYAKAHGIATIIVQDGQAAYQTRSINGVATPPWYPQYNYIGWMAGINENGNETYRLVAYDYLEAIDEWLRPSEA